MLIRTICALGLMVAAPVSALVVGVPPADAASHSCGTTRTLHDGRVAVSVTKGHVSCGKARLVARQWGAGKQLACHTNFPGRVLDYCEYFGGWLCGAMEQGNVGCVRGNIGSLDEGLTWQATRHAREAISIRLV